ncbi:hypothetical protein LCGC14_3149260, partial [marine sediment metagenome]
MGTKATTTGKLVMTGLILLLLVGALAALMPTLQSARVAAIKSGLEYDKWADAKRGGPPQDAPAGSTAQKAKPPVLQAVVKKFDAKIGLTPQLSVGTATPESIYVAQFKATIEA